jgi:hypothetical protein
LNRFRLILEKNKGLHSIYAMSRNPLSGPARLGK